MTAFHEPVTLKLLISPPRNFPVAGRPAALDQEGTMKIFALVALAVLAPLAASAQAPENYDSWPLMQSEFPSTGGNGIIIKGYDPVIVNGKCVTDFYANTPDGKAYYNVVEFDIVEIAGGRLCTNGKWRAKDGSATGTTPYRVFIKNGVRRGSP